MEGLVQEYTTQLQVMENVIKTYEERLAKLVARPRLPSAEKAVVMPASAQNENVRALTDKIRLLKTRLTLLNAKYSQKIADRETLALQERLAKSNDFIAMLVREMGVARTEVIVPMVRGYKDRIRYLEGENARLWASHK